MAWIKATPYARKIAKQHHIDLAAVTPGGKDGEIRERDVLDALEGHKKKRETPVTPLAQRIAESLRIDLSQVKGTGPGGKIGKLDVLAAAGKPDYNLKPGELRESLSPMRRAIAEQMTASGQVPVVTVTTKVDVTTLVEMREQYNAEHKAHYTVNDLVICAVAKALTRHRRFLSSFAGDSIIYKSDINIGIAVSVDDGILVPVLKEADILGMDELSEKAHELIRRAREKKLSVSECEGSTFTISNLGMYGVEAFTPMIFLPNSAILGICSIYDGVTVREKVVEARKLMHICLTFDHRILDGAQAAAFNLSVKEYLEHPEGLIYG